MIYFRTGEWFFLRRRQIKLSTEHMRWISWIIISLSVVVAIESIWLIYLKYEKSTVEVRVVEIKNSFNPPVASENPKNDVKVRHVEVEKFDYEKLVLNAATIVERASPVYIYTLSKDDSLMAIGSCGPDYIISKATSDIYSVAFLKECTRVSLLSQRRAYGVYFMATRHLGFAQAKMLDLRELSLPAFIVSYTRDGSPMYSVAIGAFPSREAAEDFMKSQDWDEIEKSVRLYPREYTACVAGCE